MRFHLDNDVPMSVANVLRRAGHDCTTASETGTARLEDDDHTVYATDRASVMVSCDRQFGQRRQRQVFGKHIYLRCTMPEAAAVLEAHLGEVLDTLQWAEHITVTVTVAQVSARARLQRVLVPQLPRVLEGEP